MSFTDIFARIKSILNNPRKRKSSEPEPQELSQKQRKLQTTIESTYFPNYQMDATDPPPPSTSSYFDSYQSNGPNRSKSTFIPELSLRHSVKPSFRTNGFRLIDDDDEHDEPELYASQPQPRRNSNQNFYAALEMPPPPPLVRATPNFTRRPPDLMPITRRPTFTSLANRQSSYGLWSAADETDKATIATSKHRLSSGSAVQSHVSPNWREWNAQWGPQQQNSSSGKAASTTSKTTNCYYPDGMGSTTSWSNRFQPKVEKFSKPRTIAAANAIECKEPTAEGFNQYKILLDRLATKQIVKVYPNRVANESKQAAKPLVTIDLCDLEESRKSLTALTLGDSVAEPKLPAINSLHSKLEIIPEFKPFYVEEVTERYANKKTKHQEQIELANQTVREHQAAASQRNKLFTKRLMSDWIVPDTPIVILDEEPEPVEEYNDFPPFTADQRAFIGDRMRAHPEQEQLISKFGLTIRRFDIQTLCGSNWLNDEVINFYMNLLTERSQLRADQGYPKVYAFSTFFMSRLTLSGHAGVRRWTRKVDVFSYDIVPVPVHVGGVHWCMAIIDFRSKSIRYYDSMISKNPAVLAQLAEYLVDEGRDKKGVPYDMTGWVMESMTNIPRQNNQCDCGVFSCTFAETISRNRPLEFSQQNMQYIRMKMVLEICKGELLL